MRHTDDTGEMIAIEIEVPSLAFFAESAAADAPSDSVHVAATLSDVGAFDPGPGRDAWSQVSRASARAVEAVEAVEGVPAASAAAASRFQFRAPIPAPGESHTFMLSVSRTYTALDGSGARRKLALHPTEQILIRVERAPQAAQDDNQQPPTLPIPGRPGAARFTPGVTTVRAVTRAEGAPATTDQPDTLTLEIQGA